MGYPPTASNAGKIKVQVSTAVLSSGFSALLLQLSPHLHYSRLQLRCELFVHFFRSLCWVRRMNRIAKSNLEGSKFLEWLSPRPNVMKAVNCHGNNRHLHVNRENRGPFLEHLRLAINRALTLRVK